jgi:hypothetical protein
MTVEDVLRELNDPDPEVRREAIRNLARLRQVDAVTALRQVAEHDPDEKVRGLAAGAVDFLEREWADVPLGKRPRRPITAMPDLSDEALRSKEVALSARRFGLTAYILIGMVVALIGALFVLLVGSGLNALRQRVGATPLPQARAEVVAEMRQVIREGREVADQLRQLPTLIVGSPGGWRCANLPEIPATYRLPDAERAAYPELGAVEGELNQARITLHDVEARWRHLCTPDGLLTEAPIHLTMQAEEFVQWGVQSLDKAGRLLDGLPPLPTPSPAAVSFVVY